MGAGDQDWKGGFVLLTSADSLIKPSSRRGQRGQAFFNRAPAEYHIHASPATRALLMSYPGPYSRDINKGKEVPWAALITHPHPFQVQQRHKRLILSGRILVSTLKSRPEELGFQKWFRDEEENSTSERRGHKVAAQTPPQIREDRGTEADTRCAPHPSMCGDGVLLM